MPNCQTANQLHRYHDDVPSADSHFAGINLAEGGEQLDKYHQRQDIIISSLRQHFQRTEPRDVVEHQIDAHPCKHAERKRPHLEETDDLFFHIQSVFDTSFIYRNQVP